MVLSPVARALICALGLSATYAAVATSPPQGAVGASPSAGSPMPLRDLARAALLVETPPHAPNSFMIAVCIFMPAYAFFVLRDPERFLRIMGRDSRHADGFVMCMYALVVGMLWTTIGVSLLRPYFEGTPPKSNVGLLLPVYFLGWLGFIWGVVRPRFLKERTVAAREPREPLLAAHACQAAMP